MTIYTFGYTLFKNGNNIDTEKMFNTLKEFGVDVLADVRSVPYSKQYPQCNADSLKYEGVKYGVKYVHLHELGAKANEDQDVFSKASDIFFDDVFPISKSNRPEQTELQANDEIVDFNKFTNDETFISGLKLIETAYDKGYKLALMCSERKTIDCHRYFLISKSIDKKFGEWMEVKHINYDARGQLCTNSNEELDYQLKEYIFKKSEITKLDILTPSFFDPPKIDNYYGDTQQEKIIDFCYRYWNLMHGWKKTGNTFNNFNNNYYD